MKDLAVKISHPDKVLFEDSGITKLGVARYYDQIWERMEPWISDRPLAIVRCPDGPGKTCFFQKHKGPGMPDNVEVSVKGEEEPLLVAKDKNALLSLVQFGALEFHAWASRFDSIEEPDLMTLDLDPGPGVKWSTVIEAAKVMAEYVRHLGFIPFLKISGGKGVHVVVPIKRGSTDWTGFKEFAHATVLSLDKMVPRQFVTVSSKAKREGRIFLDYLRNGRGATAIGPFSVRANPEASVAIPLDWGDLDSVDNPRQFTVENVETWLPLVHKNPWKDLWKSARAINEKSWKLVGFDRAVD